MTPLRPPSASAPIATASLLAAQQGPGPPRIPGGLAAFDPPLCVSGAVTDARPARTVTMRRATGPDAAPDGAAPPTCAWLGDGRPALPVRAATLDPSGLATVPSRTAGGVADLPMARPDGRGPAPGERAPHSVGLGRPNR